MTHSTIAKKKVRIVKQILVCSGEGPVSHKIIHLSAVISAALPTLIASRASLVLTRKSVILSAGSDE